MCETAGSVIKSAGCVSWIRQGVTRLDQASEANVKNMIEYWEFRRGSGANWSSVSGSEW